MSFEKNLKDLEKIVDDMSKDKISLTEAIKSFEKGMKIVKDCQKDLSKAEQSVQKLVKVHADGKIETEDFDIEE